ncbi:MAG: type I methionyl aminopeptidase [Candidatus Omnitrophica bacterium]|nr:type I methionyl aminopeptidase [Candidatus Omnitrophota bacterium]
MIPLKSKSDLAMLRESGRILAEVIFELEKSVVPGITTAEIDRVAEELISRRKVVPAFKGYRGFPAVACVSVNEEIVHGIPGSRIIKDGDNVSIDLGVNYRGYFSDAAVTVIAGTPLPDMARLVGVTRQALYEGIKAAMVGCRLGDVSHAIQKFVERNGFSVVREFVGHGIGRELHEEPEVPNYGMPGRGPLLKEGMVLAIEPMVNMGTWRSEILDNGWTAVTGDRLPSAHFEHTVAVTDQGPEILTGREGLGYA